MYDGHYDATLAWRDVFGEGLNQHLGPIRFAEADNGYRFSLDLDDRHSNMVGICHGGVLMALADSGLGASAFHSAEQKAVATISFDCQFLAAAKIGQRLHGGAFVTKRAREFLFMQGDIYAEDRHVFRCSGIWVIRQRQTK